MMQSSPVPQPVRLSRVQSIFPRNRARISRRGSQPLNTDPWNMGGHTPTTLVPFQSSLPGTLLAPTRTLDRAACHMPLFPEGRVPLMRRIPERPLKTYGPRSWASLLDRYCQAIHRVASMYRWEPTCQPTYLSVVYTGCIVSAKAAKRSHLAMEK